MDLTFANRTGDDLELVSVTTAFEDYKAGKKKKVPKERRPMVTHKGLDRNVKSGATFRYTVGRYELAVAGGNRVVTDEDARRLPVCPVADERLRPMTGAACWKLAGQPVHVYVAWSVKEAAQKEEDCGLFSCLWGGRVAGCELGGNRIAMGFVPGSIDRFKMDRNFVATLLSRGRETFFRRFPCDGDDVDSVGSAGVSGVANYGEHLKMAAFLEFEPPSCADGAAGVIAELVMVEKTPLPRFISAEGEKPNSVFLIAQWVPRPRDFPATRPEMACNDDGLAYSVGLRRPERGPDRWRLAQAKCVPKNESRWSRFGLEHEVETVDNLDSSKQCAVEVCKTLLDVKAFVGLCEDVALNQETYDRFARNSSHWSWHLLSLMGRPDIVIRQKMDDVARVARIMKKGKNWLY